MGYQTKTYQCGGCPAKYRMTVHAKGPDDPQVIDRFRLMAVMEKWVIDLDGQAWCERHREMAAC